MTRRTLLAAWIINPDYPRRKPCECSRAYCAQNCKTRRWHSAEVFWKAVPQFECLTLTLGASFRNPALSPAGREPALSEATSRSDGRSRTGISRGSTDAVAIHTWDYKNTIGRLSAHRGARLLTTGRDVTKNCPANLGSRARLVDMRQK